MPAKPFPFLIAVFVLAAIVACEAIGGISSYDPATPENPGSIRITLLYTGEETVSADHPIRVLILSNLDQALPDFAAGVHASLVLTVTQTNQVIDGIVTSPVYVMAYVDTLTNVAGLNQLEPFAAYNNTADLSNMGTFRVEGGRTNNLSLLLTDTWRFATANVTVSLQYTGTNTVNAVTNMMLYVFTNTNFSNASGTLALRWLTVPRIYLAAVLTTNTGGPPTANLPFAVYIATNEPDFADPVVLSTTWTTVTSVAFGFADSWTN
jgi:hypothetical protein